MTAVVTCLFKILATHVDPDVLDSARQLVEKAHAMQSAAIDTALYDGATFLITTTRSENPSLGDGRVGENDVKNASASDKADDPRRFARASEEIGLALLADPGDSPSLPGSEPEKLRISRVALGMALAENGVHYPDKLDAIFDQWLRTERSRPLRSDIERARRANRRPGA